MKIYQEERGKYQVSCYVIFVDSVMKQKALDFAAQIVLTDNQYSRLLPAEFWKSGDVEKQKRIEIQRTYMGKLGELAFARLLEEKNIPADTSGMLEIYEGQSHVDSFDFITRKKKTVDIKTGFRASHSRLVISTDQFDKNPKDYYVGVLLNASDTDPAEKLVDWSSVTEARILGYAEYDYLKEYAGIRDFGEGPARWRPYSKLMGIARLLKEMKPESE